MTEAIQIAWIGFAGATITAVVSIIVAIIQTRAARADREIADHTGDQLEGEIRYWRSQACCWPYCWMGVTPPGTPATGDGGDNGNAPGGTPPPGGSGPPGNGGDRSCANSGQ